MTESETPKRILLLSAVAFMCGCVGDAHNPPAILYPVILPLAIPAAIISGAHIHNQRPALKPISGGDAVDRPFVLHGEMTQERLQREQQFDFWSDNHFPIPGIAKRRSGATVNGRKIHAVVFEQWSTSAEITYFFDVTDVHIIEGEPRKSPSKRASPEP